MNDFPLESWLTEMKKAVDRIAEVGRSLLATHRQASNEAAANADRWQLAERLEEERQALLVLLDSVSCVVRLMNNCGWRDVRRGKVYLTATRAFSFVASASRMPYDHSFPVTSVRGRSGRD